MTVFAFLELNYLDNHILSQIVGSHERQPCKVLVRMITMLSCSTLLISLFQSFRGNGAYVCQENQFMEVFTVRETLDFQASLAQPSLDSSEKEQLVQKFLEDMGLVSCQDTLIGNVDLGIRGISSGQNKRLALAMALISNPNIILLDEPTSKVDSSGALHVMKTLKSQAEEKR